MTLIEAIVVFALGTIFGVFVLKFLSVVALERYVPKLNLGELRVSKLLRGRLKRHHT